MTKRQDSRATKREAKSPAAIGRLSGLVLFCLAGCQQQMADQPSYKPLEPSTFFADGQSARQLVAGTVARGYLRTDTHLFTGRKPGANRRLETKRTEHPVPTGKNVDGKAAGLAEAEFVDTFPFPVTREVLEHGRHRYMIYCVVCHDTLGTGHGKIVERGYTPPPSYHSARLRNVPIGHIFAVATEGYGSMPSYEAQISARDRWAIAAYVRALQLSQHFPADQLTSEMKQEMARQTSGKEGP